MWYQIDIPKPSAKRMEQFRTLVVELHSGWVGTRVTEYEIPAGVNTFDFELPEPIQLRDMGTLDGSYHEISVVYYNSTNTRREEIGVTATAKRITK